MDRIHSANGRNPAARNVLRIRHPPPKDGYPAEESPGGLDIHHKRKDTQRAVYDIDPAKFWMISQARRLDNFDRMWRNSTTFGKIPQVPRLGEIWEKSTIGEI